MVIDVQALVRRTGRETPRGGVVLSRRCLLRRAQSHCLPSFQLIFGSRARLERFPYIDWKYNQNPSIRDPVISLAFVGDKLVGSGRRLGTSVGSWVDPGMSPLPYPERRRSSIRLTAGKGPSRYLLILLLSRIGGARRLHSWVNLCVGAQYFARASMNIAGGAMGREGCNPCIFAHLRNTAPTYAERCSAFAAPVAVGSNNCVPGTHAPPAHPSFSTA